MTVSKLVQPTHALFPPIRSGQDADRGSNSKASQAVLSNGSKIIVPEGYGLLTFQDGELTGFAAEPGGYVWKSDNVESESIFAGGQVSTAIIRQSWERFKFGGRPSGEQLALFVSLKELPNNKFGTQSEIYWDDAYLNAQVGATTRGTYSLHIVDPILFVKNFVPAAYLNGRGCFDFTDRANDAANQLFSEVVGSLASAFSLFANDTARGNRISKIQQNSVGFAASLGQAIEGAYAWRESRGLAITKATILGVEYDEATRELLKTVQRADALSGARGNSNLQASVAAGIAAAGENEGAGGVLGLGVASGSIGLADLMQKPSSPPAKDEEAQSGRDLVGELESLKRALTAGLISQAEFDAARAKALGL